MPPLRKEFDEYVKYIQREIGYPFIDQDDIDQLEANCRKIFDQNPQVDFETLKRVADFVARHDWNHKPKFANVPLQINMAFQNGFIPALSVGMTEEEEVEEGIFLAYQVETDKAWRRYLLCCQGRLARRKALKAWQTERAGLFAEQ